MRSACRIASQSISGRTANEGASIGDLVDALKDIHADIIYLDERYPALLIVANVFRVVK